MFLELFVVVVGLVIKFGEVGSELAFFVAREFFEKVKNMDAALLMMSLEDLLVEFLR